MNLRNSCPVCGKRLHGGKIKNYIKCYVCKIKVCKSCSKYGFCMEHYNELSDFKKKKVKSNNTNFIVFVIVVPVLLSLLIILSIFIFPNIFMDIPKDTVRICVAIFVIFLMVYILMMMLLKDKEVHKILKGFEG